MRFVGKSPFGQTGSGVDLRRHWLGLRRCEWAETTKGGIDQALGLRGLPHAHHAGNAAGLVVSLGAMPTNRVQAAS